MNAFIYFIDSALARFKCYRNRNLRQYKNILDKKLKESSFDYSDDEGNSLLHLALLTGREKLYSELLEKQVDPHKENNYGITPAELRSYLMSEPANALSDTLTLKRKESESPQLLSSQEIKRRFNFRISDQLRFKEAGILDWSITRLHKLSQLLYIRKEKLWASTLFAEPFLCKKHPKIEVRFIDRLIGYGIFAGEDIRELTYIGEYTGVVRRRDKKDLLNEYTFSYTLASFETPFVIDAKDEGNFVRLINHSDAPNCSARWLISEGLSHVIIFANRFIPKGTQLTYEYGPYFWKHRTTPTEF